MRYAKPWAWNLNGTPLKTFSLVMPDQRLTMNKNIFNLQGS